MYVVVYIFYCMHIVLYVVLTGSNANLSSYEWYVYCTFAQENPRSQESIS